MAIKLDGTTGYLELGSKIAAAYPYTILAWASRANSTGNQIVFSQGQSNALRAAYAQFAASASVASAVVQNAAGNSAISYSGVDPTSTTALRLLMIVVESATVMRAYYGNATGNTGTCRADETVNHDRFTIGAAHYNSTAPASFLNGDVAEVHVIAAALTGTDWTSLSTLAVMPEAVTGWIDGFYLRSPTDLISIGGTRTLTATGGITASTITHPITRAAQSDTTPPTLLSAVVANSTPTIVNLTMSEAMDSASVPAASAFTVSGHTVSSVAISGSTINLTCSAAFVFGEAARTVGYTQPGTNNARDLATTPNLLVNFSAQAITNNVAAPPPAAVLSSAIGTPTGTTTATATVSTTVGSGTLYYYFSASATETAATIKASGLSQAVTATGSQSVSKTGLTASTQYYSHFVQVANGQDSNVADGPGFTTASPSAPVLTAPSASSVTTTTAVANVTTTIGSGTLYAYASANSTEAAATVKASGTQKIVTATGAQTVSLTGLVANTQYYLHFIHTAASVDSGVSNSTSFTTNSLTATVTLPVALCHAMGGLPLASVAGKVQFLSKTNLAAAPLANVSKTTNADGTLTPWTQAGLTAGVLVTLRWISDADGHEGYYDVTPA